MAANLEKVNGKASMFYALDTGVPWHKEGTSVATAVNGEQALELAGMNHSVRLQKIRLVDGPQIQTHRAVVRDSDNRTVGIVGSKIYKLIQNRESVDFLDSLYDDGVMLFDTGGIIDNGTSVIYWMLARMTADMRIQDDIFANYLLSAWSHDGLRSASFWNTETRVVCENTFNMAVGGKALAMIRHTGDIASKFEKARALLKITNVQHKRMEEWLRKLSEERITAEVETKVEEKLFGTLDEATPMQRRNAIETFRSIYAAESERSGETAYALVNTVTGYADHKVRVTKDGSRLSSVLMGSAAMFKKDGIDKISDLVGIKL